MSLYSSTIPQFQNTLTQIETWLDKAVEYAKAKNFDPNVLLTSRLAPDQYPLVRQIQAACDAAKFTPARLLSKEPPKHPDTETTIDELRTRLHAVREYLDSYKPEEFAGAETNQIFLTFLGGKYVLGADYVSQMQLPNFYFHASHAYAILRHNGVPVGKLDFLGQLTLH